MGVFLRGKVTGPQVASIVSILGMEGHKDLSLEYFPYPLQLSRVFFLSMGVMIITFYCMDTRHSTTTQTPPYLSTVVW